MFVSISEGLLVLQPQIDELTKEGRKVNQELLQMSTQITEAKNQRDQHVKMYRRKFDFALAKQEFAGPDPSRGVHVSRGFVDTRPVAGFPSPALMDDIGFLCESRWICRSTRLPVSCCSRKRGGEEGVGELACAAFGDPAQTESTRVRGVHLARQEQGQVQGSRVRPHHDRG